MTLSLERKQTIISKYNEGKTIREISLDMKINKSTANKWLKQYHEHGNLKRKRGSGLKKKIMQPNDINKIIEKNN